MAKRTTKTERMPEVLAQDWNAMQPGQVGWHLTQARGGWRITPVFGPEVLSPHEAAKAALKLH
ncbi:hypothetical protein [Thalassococcus sp. S3]|uniref:hypothetical protein n=1 Tax=Thalassococcus sp. S3 TaxID=2017482 RepID=UPI001024067E|nr:hypothetical protein [Thalassococcus sp. S3]QBF31506.1 hypothetical protein CFI11_09795 [Thalassococcus sp. S3]